MIKKQCVEEWKFCYCKWNTIPWLWSGVFASLSPWGTTWHIPSWSPSCLRLLCLELYLKAEQTQGPGGRYMMGTINNTSPCPCSAFQGILSVHPVDDRCSVPCLVNTPCWMHLCALVCWKPPGALVKSRIESLQYPYVNVLPSACWSYICNTKKK